MYQNGGFFMVPDKRYYRRRIRKRRNITAAWIFFTTCFLLTLLGLFFTLSNLDKEQTSQYSSQAESVSSLSDSEKLTEEERNGKEPLFLQTDERWKDIPYGSSTIEKSGCGPACLAMVVTALTGNSGTLPPKIAKYSEKNDYFVEGLGTRWQLIPEGSEHYGLYASELPLAENRLYQTLDEGGKIICAMGPGSFTAEGHFIELYGYDEAGFRIHDPNSLERSRKSWKYSEFETQIKNLWGIWRKSA